MTARNLLLRIAFNGRRLRPEGWLSPAKRDGSWLRGRLRVVF